MMPTVITDIEGTTTSLAFVKDVLFPYARQHLATFIRDHVDSENIQSLLMDARRVAGSDALTDEGVISLLMTWMDDDRKETALKELQGLVWEDGYVQGDYKGHVYPDAFECLTSWHANGMPIYVYSSGSVKAQQLLFAHTDFGDMRSLFRGYFDTRVGGKKEADSYRKIIAQTESKAEGTYFLSDIIAELDAAQSIGLRTIQLVRNSGTIVSKSHPHVQNFHDIIFN